MSVTVIAVSADLVGSRKVEDRQALADRLQATLPRVAEDFQAEWVAPLVATRGIDELSATLRKPHRVFDLMVVLNLSLWPQRFRFGVASGAVDIGLDSGDAAAMDGPAFHAASEAVARARHEGLPLALRLPEMNERCAGLAESVARLHGAIVQSWTKLQKEMVVRYRELGNQNQVAEEFQVTQQSVSGALRAARYRDLAAAEDAVNGWLAGYPEPPR